MSFDYFGNVEMDDNASSSEVKRLKEDLNNLYRKLGYKTPDEERHEQWEIKHEYDKKTKTTKELRAKVKNGFCYNTLHEVVYIGDGQI